MKKNFLKITLVLLTFVAFSCSNDDDSSQQTTNTIADFVSANPNYSSLKAALDRAGLTSTL
ncbi:MAG TPA: fasciclin domain-containing protein, partial [Mangrovimonas sp.]|nr:fasciclin domain-containing protein [Mangrovimonas sp.]